MPTCSWCEAQKVLGMPSYPYAALPPICAMGNHIGREAHHMLLHLLDSLPECCPWAEEAARGPLVPPVLPLPPQLTITPVSSSATVLAAAHLIHGFIDPSPGAPEHIRYMCQFMRGSRVRLLLQIAGRTVALGR